MRHETLSAASSATPAPIAVSPSEPAEEAGRSRALDLLTAQSFSLIALICANGAAKVDAVGRFALDGLTSRARRYLKAIDAELERGVIDGPNGTVGRFGENGHAPAIRALIREAARHREMGAVNQQERKVA